MNTAVERGCDEKSPGIYLECGISPHGLPIEYFLFDPPHLGELYGFESLSEELANKTQTWPDEQGVQHVLRWVGGSHYPYVPDFIEEARKYGVSLRLAPSFPFERLSPDSTMLLAHPHCYNHEWAEQKLPLCRTYREAVQHSHPVWQEMAARTKGHETWHYNELEDLVPVDGPCLWKAWHLIPESAGTVLSSGDYLRKIGESEYGTSYTYSPSGESASGLGPAFFGRFPISWATLVRGAMQASEQATYEKQAQAAKDAGLRVRVVHMEHDPEAGIDVEVEEEDF